MVVHLCNSSSLEVETEGLQCIGGQPELQSETCSRKRRGAKREGGKSCLRLCTVNYRANISILTDRLPPLPHLCSTWLREDGLMSWC